MLWDEFCVTKQFQLQLDKEHAKRYTFPRVSRVCLTASPICLYIFSGRRRNGDFQSHYEHHLRVAGLIGHVLLIDLALSDDHDVANSTLVNKLLEWIRSGCVVGVLLAPPCETWSEARFRRISDVDPRPLRSAAHPLALPQLTLAELEQVGVSNLLLFVALRFAPGSTAQRRGRHYGASCRASQR